MFIRDIMNKNSVVCTEDMPLDQVYELLLENDCDGITVVESLAHKCPIGAVTERDICKQIVLKNRNPRGMTAASVMNTNIVKIAETFDLDQCAELMKIKKVDRIFVTDEDGKFSGAASLADIEKAQHEISGDGLFGGSSTYAYRSPGINRIF